MTNINLDTYAAIDLGSNSFHMVVARDSNGNVVIIDKMREMVRLAGGLDDQGILSAEAIDAGISCLEKFGQRLQEIPSNNIRVVGTNTLRKARNGNVFLTRASKALGHNIEIISGREEARLIYIGVANTIFNDEDKRLVIDIGGGSSELIIGRGFDPILTESLYMGCVNTTQNFFKDGGISAKSFRKATLFARQELEAIELIYKLEGWKDVYGTSGTIRSIQTVLIENKISEAGINLDALKQLRQLLIDAEHIKNIQLDGLSNRRKPVFVGGVAILIACFEALEIDQLNVCHGALREGLLYDLIGRNQEKDIRNETVNALVKQYSLDKTHTSRIQQTANTLYEQLKDEWKLSDSDKRILGWSCELHTIGLRIAHSQYHKHGAYLIENSDMAGFSRQEQAKVANLIRFHRRKFIRDEIHDNPLLDTQTQLYLCVLLRLAVLLHRSRSSDPLPDLSIKAEKNKLALCFGEGWLKEHPLTEADLDTEAQYLEQLEIKLSYS